MFLFTGSPKITDFGVSAELGDTRALLDSFKGTVFYMSPERVENKDYDFAADVWSLGVVVLECALGKYPYDDTDGGPLGLMMQITKDDVPIPANVNLPEHLTNFVKRCMRKNPRERPSASRLRAGPHPYIAENEAVDAGTWVRSVVSPLEVLEVRLFSSPIFVLFSYVLVRANRLTACFVYLVTGQRGNLRRALLQAGGRAVHRRRDPRGCVQGRQLSDHGAG